MRHFSLHWTLIVPLLIIMAAAAWRLVRHENRVHRRTSRLLRSITLSISESKKGFPLL